MPHKTNSFMATKEGGSEAVEIYNYYIEIIYYIEILYII